MKDLHSALQTVITSLFTYETENANELKVLFWKWKRDDRGRLGARQTVVLVLRAL